MLLSLIVPVYNEEYYLRRCLGSLLRQGLERVGDYEIICVDDGSTIAALSSCPDMPSTTQTSSRFMSSGTRDWDPPETLVCWWHSGNILVLSIATTL